ncbi:MAG TPA: DUF1990 domain-containing protein [Bryobacteraceae bacterium]|nr:DUF1990 domain-containing protein [Bryobacteraceae bacterium]
MFLGRKPSKQAIHDFLDRQRGASYSYPETGATLHGVPDGYHADHNQIQIGEGREALHRAQAAVRSWKMFAMPWIDLCWPEVAIEVGSTVAVLVSHFGFYSLNAARIVYVVVEPNRFGFAYGTLVDHAEIGEERFTVEMRPAGDVWYEVLAFSRPHGFSKAAGPLARHLQCRFARDSMRSMSAAVRRG